MFTLLSWVSCWNSCADCNGLRFLQASSSNTPDVMLQIASTSSQFEARRKSAAEISLRAVFADFFFARPPLHHVGVESERDWNMNEKELLGLAAFEHQSLLRFLTPFLLSSLCSAEGEFMGRQIEKYNCIFAFSRPSHRWDSPAIRSMQENFIFMRRMNDFHIRVELHFRLVEFLWA